MSRFARRVFESGDHKFHVAIAKDTILVRRFYARGEPARVSLSEVVELSQGRLAVTPVQTPGEDPEAQLTLFPL